MAVLVLLVETLYATSGVVLNGKLKAHTHIKRIKKGSGPKTDGSCFSICGF